jgi:SHS2 domain-containing protein
MALHYPKYEEIPHTADLKIIAYGSSMENLFIHAADGMYNAARAVGDHVSRGYKCIELMAIDPETLLISFLEELLFLMEEGWFCSVQKMDINNTCFSSEVELFNLISVEKDIKAVTFHQVNIFHKDGKFQTILTFDV